MLLIGLRKLVKVSLPRREDAAEPLLFVNVLQHFYRVSHRTLPGCFSVGKTLPETVLLINTKNMLIQTEDRRVL